MNRLAVAWVLQCSPQLRHHRRATTPDTIYVLEALAVGAADQIHYGAMLRCPACHRAAPVLGIAIEVLPEVP